MTTPQIPEILARRFLEEPQKQQPFGWNKDRWMDRLGDFPEVAASLESLSPELDRGAVRKVVRENLDQDRVLAAFIPVMIWGGPGGYGAFRARSILTGVRTRANAEAKQDPSVVERLRAGANVVQESGALEAFRFMNNEGKVKYLGGAFFTKWLSFASMTDTVDGPQVAPILDKRVSDWIAHHTAGQEKIRLKTRSTPHYKRYLEILDAWGEPFGRTRTQVELAIFEMSLGR